MGYRYEYLPETGEIVELATGEKWLADEAHVELHQRLQALQDLVGRMQDRFPTRFA